MTQDRRPIPIVLTDPTTGDREAGGGVVGGDTPVPPNPTPWPRIQLRPDPLTVPRAGSSSSGSHAVLHRDPGPISHSGPPCIFVSHPQEPVLHFLFRIPRRDTGDPPRRGPPPTLEVATRHPVRQGHSPVWGHSHGATRGPTLSPVHPPPHQVPVGDGTGGHRDPNQATGPSTPRHPVDIDPEEARGQGATGSRGLGTGRPRAEATPGGGRRPGRLRGGRRSGGRTRRRLRDSTPCLHRSNRPRPQQDQWRPGV